MRLLILSDLHLELWREHAPRFDPAASKPDIVVLAGDISKGGKAVTWAAEAFPEIPVLYVHGNHEPYGGTIQGAHRETREACAQHANVHFLQCGEYIQDNVRFLGCTLWTDFQLFEGKRFSAMIEAQHAMNDYRLIRDQADYRKLRPTDTAALHAKQKSWLMQKLAEPSFGRRTVVVTHMAPSFESVAPQYASDLTSAAFASNLDQWVERSDLWIHGHMHSSFDYKIGKCRVVCNPLGYRGRSGDAENEHFDPNFIVEV
jgi:predicted phosphodiesterase